MKVHSTRVAAGRLGLHTSTLARYIEAGKVPTPNMVVTGKTTTHLWTDEEIEAVRKLLPKIANGRKTRWQRLRAKQRTQAGASPPQPRQKRPGPGTPGPALQETKKQPKKQKKK